MRRPKDHRHGRHIVFASRRMDHRARNLRRRGEELSEDRTLPLVVSDALDVAHQHRVRAIDPVEKGIRLHLLEDAPRRPDEPRGIVLVVLEVNGRAGEKHRDVGLRAWSDRLPIAAPDAPPDDVRADRENGVVLRRRLLAPTPFRRFRQTPDLIDASSMRPICPYLFTNRHRNMRFEKQ